MENLWHKAHQFILDSKVGDFYESGGNIIYITKRTPKRIHLSNGVTITISKSKFGFFFFKNDKVNQILRDIEGYLLFQVHTNENNFI